MNLLKKCFEEIGIKKLALSFHYILAIGTSLLFFITCIVCTFIPQTVDITELKEIYKIIMIYCAVIILYITILCIFDKMQTMHDPNTKFDFIAFYIGIAMFFVIGLIITCVCFMFIKQINETEVKMWQIIIGIFGGVVFGAESVGGYIYKIFKAKFKNKTPELIEPMEPIEPVQEPNVEAND